MRQLSLFSRAEISSMRDRTRRRNYSAGGEEFRREHARRRAWGLQQRHARKLNWLRRHGGFAYLGSPLLPFDSEVLVQVAGAWREDAPVTGRKAAGEPVEPGRKAATSSGASGQRVEPVSEVRGRGVGPVPEVRGRTAGPVPEVRGRGVGPVSEVRERRDEAGGRMTAPAHEGRGRAGAVPSEPCLRDVPEQTRETSGHKTAPVTEDCGRLAALGVGASKAEPWLRAASASGMALLGLSTPQSDSLSDVGPRVGSLSAVCARRLVCLEGTWSGSRACLEAVARWSGAWGPSRSRMRVSRVYVGT